MKAFMLTVSAFLLACAPASAARHGHETDNHHHSSPPCDFYFSTCSAKFPDSVRACRILFEAAKASGGYRGEPDAHKAAQPYWGASARHIHPRARFCVP